VCVCACVCDERTQITDLHGDVIPHGTDGEREQHCPCTHRNTHRPTGRQAGRQTGTVGQAQTRHRESDTVADRTDRQTGRQLSLVHLRRNMVPERAALTKDRQTDRHTYIHTDRQTDRQTGYTDRQVHTDRHTDRHADRQTDTQTDTQTDVHSRRRTVVSMIPPAHSRPEATVTASRRFSYLKGTHTHTRARAHTHTCTKNDNRRRLSLLLPSVSLSVSLTLARSLSHCLSLAVIHVQAHRGEV